MTWQGVSNSKYFRPAAATALAVICGLGLWATTLGEKSAQNTIGSRWDWASYDYLFRFGSPAVTNQVVVILMDNASYANLHQSRGQQVSWDRALHAQLANKLADDGCPLVIFDVQFSQPKNPDTDQSFAAALHRLKKVVLEGKLNEENQKQADIAQVDPPMDSFLEAAGKNNWGLAAYDADLDSIVRRHWPFPSQDTLRAVPEVAATLSGVHLSREPEERWLRYYDFNNALTYSSYYLALTTSPGYFRDKVVFIGNDPDTKLATEGNNKDKFNTPFTYWTGESVGGVEILATAYLNLVRGDWLRTPAWPVEALVFIVTGVILGIVLCRFSRLKAAGVAVLLMIVFSVAGIGLSQVSNYWFPWLMVVGGQVPCALVVAILVPLKVPEKVLEKVPEEEPAAKPNPKQTIMLSFPEEKPPDAPDYELLQPPIGEGGFGKVWIVRNAIGQWQALKAVYQSKFGENRHPYESEFRGLQKYKPVSEKHPGLLRIDLVSKMKEEGYFYYVMELGDAQQPGWEHDPSLYKPRDLENMRKKSANQPLPLAECIRIGTVLADALSFLHSNGLTHRDIKPSNVIFVNDRPKLADIGLVTDIRPPEEIKTFIGTPGYMPPPPEPPGTPQADIYAMGMVLYVISTGNSPKFFPDIATTLLQRKDYADFMRFDAVVLKACQPDIKQRYQDAREMLKDLENMTSAKPQ